MSKTASQTIKCAVSLMLVISLFLCLSVASFAWLVMNFRIVPQDDFYASSIAAYFAGGDGSKENPYLITLPNHLYNLAWLQYLGVFNRVNDSGQIEKQFYFKMLNDVDMSGLIIPPIGTEENPFVGNFNGNNCTISNAVISNYIGGEGGIQYSPSSVKTLDNTIKVDGREVEASIVGFFGVVGNWDKTISGLNDDSLTVDIPSKVNSVYNFFLRDLTIRSDTDQSLMGLLAGYVDGSIQNVGIGGTSSLVVGEDVKALNLSGLEMQALVSKYSLIGEYDELDVSWPDKPVLGGWGGTIDMANLFTRITDIVFANYDSSSNTLNGSASDYTYIYTSIVNVYLDENGNETRTETTRVDDAFIQYNRGSAGNYILSRYKNDNTNALSTSKQFMYLYGNVFRQTVNTYQTKTTQRQVSTISSSDGKFLSLNSRKDGVANADEDDAAKWFWTGEYLGTYDASSGTVYYLTRSSNSLSVRTEPSTTWTYSGNRLYRSTGTAYYVRYSDGWRLTREASDATAVTFTDAGTVDVVETELISTEKQYYEDENNVGTWFPLSINDETGEVANWNTGYVVSGSYENPDTSSGYPYKSGSIRVSRYDSDKIKNSGDGGNNSYTLVSNQIRTISYKKQSFGVVGATTKSTDQDGNAVYTLNSNLYALEKFEASYAALCKTINKQRYVYGLHFMDAQIDIDSTIRIDKAVIMDKKGGYDEYTNYELPRNAITFNLSEKGFINFYAGTYFTGNKSFFSLYKIERDKNQNLSSIREISKIYGMLDDDDIIDISKEYIYEYVGESIDIPDGYTMLFDATWITAPKDRIDTNYFNYIYYFEIPVNDGEYALGSVKGSDGAYLLYLDLAISGTRRVASTPTHTISSINFADETALANKSIENYPVVTMSAEILSQTHAEAQISYHRTSVKQVLYQVDGNVGVTPVAETGATASETDNLIVSTVSLLSLAWSPGKEGIDTC